MNGFPWLTVAGAVPLLGALVIPAQVAMLPLFAPSLVQAFALIYVFGNNGIVSGNAWRLHDVPSRQG